MTGQYKALRKIDIAEARKSILKSISQYDRLQRLSDLLEPFLRALPQKVDRRVADKLHKLLTKQAPEVKVYRVAYTPGKTLTGQPEFGLRIYMYEMDDLGEMSLAVRPLVGLTEGDLVFWDVDNAMIAMRRWGKHADFLRERLTGFAYNANKFNEALDSLKKCASLACPKDELGPVWPLSQFLHWYQLNSQGN